ncbi:MAG: transglutaminase family protein [Chitinophagaceae bacterium]|nr:transglutaminase family protein [Chitinophagaceae bacterium]
MPVFRIHHVTKYEYDRPVKESMNSIMIYPFQSTEQETLQHELFITGSPEVFTYIDYWGNRAGTFNLLPLHTELVIESKLLVRTLSSEAPVLPASSIAELEALVNKDLQLAELARVSAVKRLVQMEEYVAQLFDPGKTIAGLVEDTCGFIFSGFTYIKGITNIETTVDDILEKKAGVCQDFAHVMLELLRMMGIPARYVSGYICPNKNGMRGEGATHAWVEAYIPGAGWTGSDPTNNIWVTNHHVKLAVGRDFNSCSPVKGSFKGPARQSLSVYVSVGYEDGETFGALNKVELEKQPGSEIPEPIFDTFAGQQQQ